MRISAGRPSATPWVDHGAVAILAAFEAMHLQGVLDLCRAEGWPTFPSDPDRALRALLATGTVTVVALHNAEVIGFAHALTDRVTTYLAELLVTPAYRGRGIGRALVTDVFGRSGTKRMDALTDTAEDFYAGLPHRRFAGFRLYPGPQEQPGDAVGPW